MQLKLHIETHEQMGERSNNTNGAAMVSITSYKIYDNKLHGHVTTFKDR